MKMLMYIPHSYANATPEERAKVCNGCGAKNGVKVPDTMWGLSIKEACQIHDWMYHIGTTLGDKIFADFMFLLNMIAIIAKYSKYKLVSYLRMARAIKYYFAVAFKGFDAYWENKVESSDTSISIKGEYQNA